MALIRPKYSLPLLVLLVLLLTFLFFLNNLRHPPKWGFVEKWAFSLVSQFQKSINIVLSFPIHVWRRYVFLVETEENNQRLIEENKILRQENALLGESALANQRLRELLDFKNFFPQRLVAAEVVGVDASLYFKSFFIDKGEKNGLRGGMAVICPDGVVGRVLRVADSFSMVLLLIDQGFALDALIRRTRTRGVVVGTGGDLCRMKYVLPSEDVKSGDLVVSSGLEGFFPKGMIIGGVISTKKSKSSVFQDVIIKPMVKFRKTEEVFVVLDNNP